MFTIGRRQYGNPAFDADVDENSVTLNEAFSRRTTLSYVYDLGDNWQSDDLAKFIRGHWGIEGRLHLIRDVAFNEDYHRARTGNAPRNLAVLRNTAITLHRQNGATGIQPALRAVNRRPERLLHLLPKPA